MLRWRRTGTFQNDAWGLRATGNRLSDVGVTILGIDANNMISQSWEFWDVLNFFTQLGVIREYVANMGPVPAPAPAAAPYSRFAVVARRTGESQMRRDITFASDGIDALGMALPAGSGQGHRPLAGDRHGQRVLRGQGNLPCQLRRALRRRRLCGVGLRLSQLRQQRRRAALPPDPARPDRGSAQRHHLAAPAAGGRCRTDRRLGRIAGRRPRDVPLGVRQTHQGDGRHDPGDQPVAELSDRHAAGGVLRLSRHAHARS